MNRYIYLFYAFINFCIAAPVAFAEDFAKLPNPLGVANIHSIGDVVARVEQIVLLVAVPVVTIMIIYAGFMYVAAYGNPEKIKAANRRFMWTLLGSILLFGATSIANLVITTVQKVTTEGVPQGSSNTTNQNTGSTKPSGPGSSNTLSTGGSSGVGSSTKPNNTGQTSQTGGGASNTALIGGLTLSYEIVDRQMTGASTIDFKVIKCTLNGSYEGAVSVDLIVPGAATVDYYNIVNKKKDTPAIVEISIAKTQLPLNNVILSAKGNDVELYKTMQFNIQN